VVGFQHIRMIIHLILIHIYIMLWMLMICGILPHQYWYQI